MKTLNILLPFTDTYDGGIFKGSTTSEQASKTNLISLLTTKRGHRVMRNRFYSPIWDAIMEPLDEVALLELDNNIRDKVTEFIPEVNIKKINFTKDYDINLLNIKIIYIETFNAGETQVLNISVNVEPSNLL